MSWPALRYETLRPTAETLQLWTQIAGKVAVARTPWLNHSWHVALQISARGLAMRLLPNGDGGLQLELDLLSHQLVIRTTEGGEQRVALAGRTAANFFAETMQALERLGARTRIVAVPNELPEATPFAADHAPRPYDAEVAQDLWRALVQMQRVFGRFRSCFLGKSSPIHFFWGGADLALTRFSGRRAAPHPGGVPHLPDDVTREAYSHEVSSAGFWPGDPRAPEPSFYAYAYPTPPGYAEAKVEPAGARWDPALGEFLMPYDRVRTAADPDEALMAFLQTSYAAAADLAGWNRAELECGEGPIGRPRAVG